MKNLILAALLAQMGGALFGQSAIDYVNQLRNKPNFDARQYNFSVTSGQGVVGSLAVAGANTLTFSYCPYGLAVSNSIYISGGTGTAEAVAISSLTCTSGLAGSVTFTTANTHTGAWVVSSATSGIQEAICSMPSSGGLVNVVQNSTLQANVGTCGKTGPNVQKTPSATITANGHSVLGGAINAADFTTTFFPYPGSVSPETNPFKVNTGGYPPTAQFGGGSNGTVENLVGLIDVPVGGGGIFATGISGYARTAATAVNGVGVFGVGKIGTGAGAGTGAWGANFAVNNCPTAGCIDTSGIVSANLTGVEVDMNIYTPTAANAIGLSITGGTPSTQAASITDGILIGPLGAFATPPIAWKNAIETADGAANFGIVLGSANYSGVANSASQGIVFHGFKSSVRTFSTIGMDNGGNLILAPYPTSLLTFQDGAGVTIMSMLAGAVGLGTSTTFGNSAVAFAALPGLASGRTAGAQIYCTNCNINVSPCTSGGPGALAVYNGTQWNCSR